jgi:hypothetical protein
MPQPIVEEQPSEATLDLPAADEGHHLQMQLVGQLAGDATTVAVRGNGGQGTPPDLSLLLNRDATLDVQRHADTGANVTANPRRVAGHVNERAQQYRDAHVLECRRDHRVFVVERFTGMRIPTHSFPPTRCTPRVQASPTI